MYLNKHFTWNALKHELATRRSKFLTLTKDNYCSYQYYNKRKPAFVDQAVMETKGGLSIDRNIHVVLSYRSKRWGDDLFIS